MKRGTPDHPKMLMLMQRLGLSKCAAVGVVEMLWQVAARYAANGDIGRYPRGVIVSAMGYDGDADELFEALIDCGWMDRLEHGVEYIHDWHEHCEDATHLHLARRTQRFANGQVPSLKRLNRDERESIEAAFADMRTPCAQEAHKKRTADALADADAIAFAYADADAEPRTGARARGASGDETTEHTEHTEPDRSANSNGKNGPETVAEVLSSMGIRESVAREWCRRTAAAIQGHCREGPGYGRWWLEVCGLAAVYGLEDDLEGWVRYMRDCGDEKTRKAKDLGELKAPAKWLAKQCRDALSTHGVKLPKPPSGAVVSSKGGKR